MLDRVDADGEGRQRRPLGVETEDSPQRRAELAAGQVEEGGVKGAESPPAVTEQLGGLLENIAIMQRVGIRGQRLEKPQIFAYSLCILSLKTRWAGLAETGELSIGKLDRNHPNHVLRLP